MLFASSGVIGAGAAVTKTSPGVAFASLSFLLELLDFAANLIFAHSLLRCCCFGCMPGLKCKRKQNNKRFRHFCH